MEDNSSTIFLDPSGDMRLITSTQEFVVSSKVMCLASRVWRAMCDPQGPWAKQSSEGIFNLPEDDPDALLILLRIAHLQFSDLPDAIVVYEHLLQLAVLCDKYDTVQPVRPWILKWQAPLQAQAEESRQKGGEGYEGYETWLFIAWTFGDEAVFRKISRSLVLTSTINGEKNGDHNLLANAQGNIIGDIMPVGSLDAINEARSERISALLEMCYKLVGQHEGAILGDTAICTRGQFSEECDSLTYGCLIRGLQGLELFPERAKACQIALSVTTFADQLRSLNCFTYSARCDHHRHYYAGHHNELHSSCSFALAFADQIQAIIDHKEPSGVLEEHLTHIGEQKK